MGLCSMISTILSSYDLHDELSCKLISQTIAHPQCGSRYDEDNIFLSCPSLDALFILSWITEFFPLCPPLIRPSVVYVKRVLLYTRSVMPVPENE